MLIKYWVYSITNNITGKMYIGISKNYKSRWADHIKSMSKPSTSLEKGNVYLRRSANKHGVDSMKFNIIFCCYGLENANFYEKYFISLYNTYGTNGYNQTLGGDGSPGCKLSEKAKLLIAKSKSIPVTIDGCEHSSILQASIDLSLPRSHVYKLVREGYGTFTTKFSNYNAIGIKTTRVTRLDACMKTYEDYVLEYLTSVGGIANTIQIREALSMFHRESLAGAIRGLCKKGITISERANLSGRFFQVKVVKLVDLSNVTPASKIHENNVYSNPSGSEVKLKFSDERLYKHKQVVHRFSYEKYSLLGDFLQVYRHIDDLASCGFTPPNVSKAASNLSTHKGYYWRKIPKIPVNSEDSYNIDNKCKKLDVSNLLLRSCSLYECYNMLGDMVASYTAKELKHNSLDHSAVLKCCNRVIKSYKGFVWKKVPNVKEILDIQEPTAYNSL